MADNRVIVPGIDYYWYIVLCCICCQFRKERSRTTRVNGINIYLQLEWVIVGLTGDLNAYNQQEVR